MASLSLTAMLKVSGVHTFYGNIEALKGVDLEIGAGEIVALIGANGAGKSTLLMTLCGRPRAARGQILFEGRDITRLATFEIVRLGIAQAPEGRRIFPRMTVFENLQMGASLVDPALVDDDLARVFSLFPILERRRGQRGGTLSGGEQQMLAISRALAGDTKVLLLDEISMGLAPIIVGRLFELVAAIAAGGVTVVLVEQFAETALGVADRAAIMLQGRIAHEGTPADMSAAAESSYL